MHPEWSEEEFQETHARIQQQIDQYDQDYQKKNAAFSNTYNSWLDDIIRSTIWAVLRRWAADLYDRLRSIFRR